MQKRVSEVHQHYVDAAERLYLCVPPKGVAKQQLVQDVECD